METKIIEAIRDVIDSGAHLLHQPYLEGKEQEYVRKVLASGHLSAGGWVDKFECDLAAFIGAKHCVAVTNATCGLHAIVTAMPKLDEYRMPSLTFVATANALAYGGNKIRFVEHYAYADVVVDLLGHPHFNVGSHIRDAAQALGSKRDGRYVGSVGTAVFSFNQNKIITGGSGGAIVTDDHELAKKIRHLVTTARVDHKWETSHNAVAFNYRMSDVTAAILCAQLEALPLILKAKRALAMKYKEAFSGVSGVTFWDEPSGCRSNFWLNAIRLEDESRLIPCLEALHKEGILTKPLYEPIHRLPMYADYPRDDLSKTEDLLKRTILLPSSPRLGMRFL